MRSSVLPRYFIKIFAYPPMTEKWDKVYTPLDSSKPTMYPPVGLIEGSTAVDTKFQLV